MSTRKISSRQLDPSTRGIDDHGMLSVEGKFDVIGVEEGLSIEELSCV
jgi:hypothetical protein